MLFKAAWNSTKTHTTPYIHTTHTNTNTHLLKASILTYQEKGLGCCKPSKLRERERERMNEWERWGRLYWPYTTSQVKFPSVALQLKKKEFRALHYKVFISTNVFHFISFFNFFLIFFNLLALLPTQNHHHFLSSLLLTIESISIILSTWRHYFITIQFWRAISPGVGWLTEER